MVPSIGDSMRAFESVSRARPLLGARLGDAPACAVPRLLGPPQRRGDRGQLGLRGIGRGDRGFQLHLRHQTFAVERARAGERARRLVGKGAGGIELGSSGAGLRRGCARVGLERLGRSHSRGQATGCLFLIDQREHLSRLDAVRPPSLAAGRAGP